MNYQKIYNDIILKAKSENRKKLKKTDDKYIYYENHHILPKCLGGIYDEKNLVLLTAREHFVCHKLLTYIYPNNRKIVCAFHYMCFNNKANRKLSSNDYEYAIKLMRSVPPSEETKEKQSRAIKPTKGKTFEEIYGKERAEEILLKHHISGQKIIFPKYRGKKISLSLKSKQNIQCPHCLKIMNNSNGAYTKWHGNNCKLLINN
jgi:hypothetical protein